MNYSFKNAIANLKEGATPLDEAKLRQTPVYGKLMLSKGTKVDQIKSKAQFLTNEDKTFVRAELFVIGSRGQVVTDQRVYLNVDINSDILFDEANKMYFVELQHPTLDVSKATKVTFG